MAQGNSKTVWNLSAKVVILLWWTTFWSLAWCLILTFWYQVIDFLTHLFISGIGYNAMNTARCALSTFVILEGNISVGSHPLVKRFLKAVYQCRPAFPRYTFVWDISIVLKYLKALPSLQDLQLKTLTLKLAMLCSLVTGQRSQSLHLMSLDHMSKGPDHCVFHIQDIVKQSAPGRKQPELIIPVFRAEPKLCVISHLMEYLHRTEKLRGEENITNRQKLKTRTANKDDVIRLITWGPFTSARPYIVKRT